MSGQYTIEEEDQKYILAMLKRMEIQTNPTVQELWEDGKARPFHREVKIHVCSIDDEDENYHMYVEID